MVFKVIVPARECPLNPFVRGLDEQRVGYLWQPNYRQELSLPSASKIPGGKTELSLNPDA